MRIFIVLLLAIMAVVIFDGCANGLEGLFEGPNCPEMNGKSVDKELYAGLHCEYKFYSSRQPIPNFCQDISGYRFIEARKTKINGTTTQVVCFYSR